MEAHGAVGLDNTHVQEIYNAGDTLPAIIMISKAKGSSGVGDPLDEVSSVGWKSWHTGSILNTAWIRGLRTGSAKLI